MPDGISEKFKVGDKITAKVWRSSSVYMPPINYVGMVIKIHGERLDVRLQRWNGFTFIKRCIHQDHVEKL